MRYGPTSPLLRSELSADRIVWHSDKDLSLWVDVHVDSKQICMKHRPVYLFYLKPTIYVIYIYIQENIAFVKTVKLKQMTYTMY